jgi:hypothetical protein
MASNPNPVSVYPDPDPGCTAPPPEGSLQDYTSGPAPDDGSEPAAYSASQAVSNQPSS